MELTLRSHEWSTIVFYYISGGKYAGDSLPVPFILLPPASSVSIYQPSVYTTAICNVNFPLSESVQLTLQSAG